ncbi:hypothetical protein SLEP1_g929 [Rubroshorea leprosula]|uniref:Uncharacterized protein n=1 Tax=Rubroshorea leprosula TaxID=152421 RepID=A0AAV5HGU5_9ROSI|nr:hypothetical protein SLEP1_g929 [Rubroshorea leprosula]
MSSSSSDACELKISFFNFISPSVYPCCNFSVWNLNGIETTHVCKYLVEEVKVDIDVEEKKFGSTPLHQAILHERFQTAVHPLESGANPNAVTHNRRTALHFAAKKGS